MTTRALAINAMTASVVGEICIPAANVNLAQMDARQAIAKIEPQLILNAKGPRFDLDDYAIEPGYTDMLQQQVTFVERKRRWCRRVRVRTELSR